MISKTIGKMGYTIFRHTHVVQVVDAWNQASGRGNWAVKPVWNWARTCRNKVIVEEVIGGDVQDMAASR